MARHLASESPKYLTKADVPEAEVKYEREILRSQLGEDDNMNHMFRDENAVKLSKILEGKLQKKFYQVVCLHEQEWLYDDGKKVKDILKEEGVEVAKFVVVNHE